MRSAENFLESNGLLSEALRLRAGRPRLSPRIRQAVGKWLDSDQPARMRGWTTIAPVPLDSPFMAPAIEILDRMKSEFAAGDYSRHPLSSLHMTVMPGFAEMDMKDAYPAWATDAESVSVMCLEALERIKDAHIPELGKPLMVQVTGFRLSNTRSANAMVEPATEEDRQWLTSTRAAIAEAVGYRSANHDSYQHHISFGYRLTHGADSEERLGELSQSFGQRLKELGPFELETPAFSIFETMLSFPPVYRLGQAS